MTPEEIDEFLAGERTCRLASVTPSGAPHVSALWFAWDGASMWFYSIVKSRRWDDIAAPQAAVAQRVGQADRPVLELAVADRLARLVHDDGRLIGMSGGMRSRVHDQAFR